MPTQPSHDTPQAQEAATMTTIRITIDAQPLESAVNDILRAAEAHPHLAESLRKMLDTPLAPCRLAEFVSVTDDGQYTYIVMPTDRLSAIAAEARVIAGEGA